MTPQATRTALRKFGPCTKAAARAIWQEKTLASLEYVRRMGGTYASSTFIALLALVEGSPDLRTGDRIGMFSYGSGSCAEYYSGLLGPDARRIAAEAGVRGLLDERYRLHVGEYEAIERERTDCVDSGDFVPTTDLCDGLYDRVYRGRGKLVFRGVHEHYRQYAWS